MLHSHRSSYRGCGITTHWAEQPACIARGTRYTASFSVDPGTSSAEAMQEFLSAAFTTTVAASANARIAAMEAIDVVLGAPYGLRTGP